MLEIDYENLTSDYNKKQMLNLTCIGARWSEKER